MVLLILLLNYFKPTNSFGGSGLITGKSRWKHQDLKVHRPLSCLGPYTLSRWLIKGGSDSDDGGGFNEGFGGGFWSPFLPFDIEPGMEGHSNGGFSDVPNWEVPKAPPKIKSSVTDLLFPDLYKMTNKKRNQVRVLRNDKDTGRSRSYI